MTLVSETGLLSSGFVKGVVVMRLGGVALVALSLVACGKSSSDTGGSDAAGSGSCGSASECSSSGAAGISGSAASGTSGRAGGGAAGASGTNGGEAGTTSEAGSGGGTSTAGRITSPDVNDHLIVHGLPRDVHYAAAELNGKPFTTGQWATDDTRIGSITADGVLHVNGFVGGVIVIAFTTGDSILKTTLTVDVDIVENPAALAAADQVALATGGPADPKFKFLYPYDATVFPRGVAAPVLQFGDGKTTSGLTAETLYLQLTTDHFSYQQYAVAGAPVRALVPEAVWQGVTLSAGPNSLVKAAVSKRAAGVVAGPTSESWRIAQASLKGLIYYNTYGSVLLPSTNGSGGGGTLSVRAGGPAKVVQKGCVVCHSVAASGSLLTASLGPDLAVPTSSAAYGVEADGSSAALYSPISDGRVYSFAALTPDGRLAVSNGIPFNALPPQLPHGLHVGSDSNATDGYHSTLIDTKTGASLSSASLNAVVKYAQTPKFSVDGKKLAFVNGDKWPARQLATLDFDGTQTFSKLATIVSNNSELTNSFGTPQLQVLSWPSFTPDSAALVYQQGDSFDSSLLVGGLAASAPQYAEARLAELDGTVRKLNALNGRDAAGVSYLPYGEAAENQLNYEPAVSPIAAGGYFWVVFTSRRAYGNTIAPGRVKTTIAYDDPTQDPWGSEAAPSQRKKVWVAAIDVDHVGKLDPSHPAFYLPGQELESANQHPQPALAACQANGVACESGADCCAGYCRQKGADSNGKPLLQCVAPPANTCSNEDEPCANANDCCAPSNSCLAGRCAMPTPK